MRLEFDKEKERFYETGCKNCVLYTDTVSKDYGLATAWNGITSFDDTPEGAEPNDMYADDIKYLSIRSAETYGFTINAYSSPEEFDECDGSKQVVPGVTLGQQSRKRFGLSIITTLGNDEKGNDYGELLHLIYNATASPSQKTYSTINESPEAIEFSWTCSTNPVNNSYGKPSASMTIDSTKVDTEKYAAFKDILYGTNADATLGTEATNGYLPSIDEVIRFFSSNSSETVLTPVVEGEGDGE